MKKIIIIGGGFAGSFAAKKLELNFDVTLIDTKDYFEFTPSILRTLVEPEHLKKIQVKHKQYLHKTHLVYGEVTSIDKNKVSTYTKSYPYDYLIIASGSKYNLPIKAANLVMTTRAHDLRDYSKKLVKAKSVLIIGGGLVGVELAAEIIEKFPDKKITLVHSHSELIERNPKTARDYARKFLETRDVKIIFDERVETITNNTYKTNKEKMFYPDLAFLCTGIKPNYEFLRPHFTSSLDERNSVIINKYLQVKDYQNIFAAGDITTVRQEKTAQNAEYQAKVVVDNISHLEKSEKLKEYQVTKTPLVISLGKWHGILVINSWVLTGLIPGIMKSLIEWKEMKRYKN